MNNKKRIHAVYYKYKTLPISVCYIEIITPISFTHTDAISFTHTDAKRVDPGFGTHYQTEARSFFELFCRTLICRPDLIESLWNQKYE